MAAPTFEEKMAARRDGTTTVTVHPHPALVGQDPTGIEAKFARHRLEGKTEAQRAAEKKAAEAKAAAAKPEAKPKADDTKK